MAKREYFRVLEHLLADVAGEEVLVGSFRRQPTSGPLGQRRGLNGRSKHFAKDVVEVDLLVADSSSCRTA